MADRINNETYESLCNSITPLLEQKRNIATLNIPPPRINILSESPYPQYSSFQLNMRRKVEILKYKSSQQNTKGNNPTKKQTFASLAKSSSSSVHYQFNNSYSNLVCKSDLEKPTLSTAANIPGPPIVLQYDPGVKLYNYGNFMNNRSYAITTNPSDVTYNAYSLNIIEYINPLKYTLTPDRVIQNDTASYTYSGNLGTILIGNNLKDQTYSFNISTPIAIWFYGSIGSDTSYPKEKITTNTVNRFLNITISDITANVYYNDKLITSIKIQQPQFNPITVNCDLNKCSSLFYAIQYVGMLNINNLILKTPPQTMYTIKYLANYKYNSLTVNKYLDFIKTGIFANLNSATDNNYILNCILDSNTPTDFVNGTFTQFSVP